MYIITNIAFVVIVEISLIISFLNAHDSICSDEFIVKYSNDLDGILYIAIC